MNIQSFFKVLLGTLLIATLSSLSSCAVVHQMDRENLSRPIMLPSDDELESTIEGHDTPRREGSSGGNAGAGGGCGC